MNILPRRIGPLVDWSRLRTTVQTGDIILCQTRNVKGFLQELATDAPYTHSAVFVRFTNGRLMILESATDKDYQDVFTKKTDGPKLLDADFYIHKYLSDGDGVVTYRSLRYSDGGAIMVTIRQKTKMYTFISHVIDPSIRYERQLLDIPNALLRFRVRDHSDPSSMFCSELVAGFLIAMGVPMIRQADKIIPRDFGTGFEDCFDRRYNKGPDKAILGVEMTIRDR